MLIGIGFGINWCEIQLDARFDQDRHPKFNFNFEYLCIKSKPVYDPIHDRIWEARCSTSYKENNRRA